MIFMQNYTKRRVYNLMWCSANTILQHLRYKPILRGPGKTFTTSTEAAEIYFGAVKTSPITKVLTQTTLH
jgi:hypothetical protein